ncbi:hypothetical protein OA2633_01424 [Oceanicaulis alexandrii HTCC2633]|uniref:hypothetical protein n=1 Tax=Oceanicaulis sp. HTCC2633 TaxID=314254 RepID=UPI000066B0A5|nr:hypothetical protein [Oceanicaulis sp. HTCC2633]EAP88967.1 hypothetical protein OA2633_01424 [Oceanicaulis alexandrii HTCC2633] [Oceanicaulis sp. HTCC2633]
MTNLPRLLMIGFGLVAILGALLASGRLGEGGVQMAVGITLLVTGAIGVMNTIFFTRLKRSLDDMASKTPDAPGSDASNGEPS